MFTNFSLFFAPRLRRRFIFSCQFHYHFKQLLLQLQFFLCSICIRSGFLKVNLFLSQCWWLQSFFSLFFNITECFCWVCVVSRQLFFRQPIWFAQSFLLLSLFFYFPSPSHPMHLSPGIISIIPTCGKSLVSSIARPFDDCPYSSLPFLMLILQYFGYSFTKKISKSFFFIKKWRIHKAV